MSALGITLLVVGVIIFAISFFIPDKDEKLSRREKEKQQEKQQEEIRKMMEKELDSMKLRVNEATNETVEYGMDKVERSLEKISNEKIMAVNEYAGTIMEEIDRNHKEIMFLYDMLNDKQVDIKNTVRKAEATAKEVNEAAKNVQESYDAAQMEFERQIQEQNSVVNNMNMEQMYEPFVEEPLSQETIPVIPTMPIVQAIPAEPVMYHGKIDESIFENMTRTDLAPDNNVDTPVMPEITSLFNSALNSDDVLIEREIPVEQFTKPQEEIVPEPDTTSDLRSAQFPVEGNNNQKILALYERGMQVVDIARELNLGVGEVQLVIDLFK